jgi:hypothetical protein
MIAPYVHFCGLHHSITTLSMITPRWLAHKKLPTRIETTINASLDMGASRDLNAVARA